MNRILVLFGGISGGGKNSIHEWLVKKYPQIYKKFRNSTTRTERAEERKKRIRTGIQTYNYLTVKEFEEKRKSQEIYESTVFCGNLYGMSKSAIEEVWAEGLIAVNDCELSGIKASKELYREDCITFFVKPDKDNIKSLQIAEARLRSRYAKEMKNKDKAAAIEADIRKRLAHNAEYINHDYDFDFTVVNGEGQLDTAGAKVHDIIKKHFI